MVPDGVAVVPVKMVAAVRIGAAASSQYIDLQAEAALSQPRRR